MAFTTTSALAVTFAWASAPACWTITISGSPYTVNVDALAAARMCLGREPGGILGTNGAIDFVRHVEESINDAVVESGRSFTLTFGADDRLKLAVDSGSFTLAHSTPAGLLLARYLGWIAGGTGASFTAVDPPWYLATAISVEAGVPVPRRAGAAERDAAGRVYSFGAGGVSYDRRLTLGRIPRQPVVCADEGCHATPFLPADAYLHDIGDTSAQRRWSWLDCIEAARNATVAVALYNWQTLGPGDSTSATYYEGFLAPGTLGHEQEPAFTQPSWPVWVQHEITHILPDIDEAVVATRA